MKGEMNKMKNESRRIEMNGKVEYMSLKKLCKWVGVELGKEIWSESK